MLTRIGTPNYMALELLFENDDEVQDSPCALAVDIWSVSFRLLSAVAISPAKTLATILAIKKNFPHSYPY